MLFVLGLFFIIITIGIIVYNRPKGKTVVDAILDSGNNLYADKAEIKKSNKPSQTHNKPSQTHNKPSHTHNKPSHTHNKPSHTHKKEKHVQKDPDVIIGDECSDSLDCPVSLGDGGHKNEQRCRAIFEKIYNKPFPTVRPKWLKNPATKRSLELDMYCHKLEFINSNDVVKKIRLAAEFDGEQHYKMTQYHGNKKELLYQMKRDMYKTKKCKELGITLIRIPYWAKSDLEGYILRKLKEHNLVPKGYVNPKL